MTRRATGGEGTRRARPRVAYVVSWFPAVTETFVLEEVRDLRARGVEVDVFPLFGARGGEVHAAWRELAPHTHYNAALSWELLAAQAHWLRRRPRAYLRAWWDALRATAPSRKLLVRAPVVIAKAALLARRVEATGVRHVHAHFATHPALAAWVVRALAGTGYSFTAHAHDLYVDTAMLREKVRDARFVVTISEFNRALLERHCGAQAARKVHVVRCGVDLGAFEPRPRRAPEVPTFVCVASLRPYKGHAVLLDACRLLRARGVRARVLLVGDGELRRRLAARIARERLGDTVELLGARPHEAIPELLAGATAMVLPSVRARDGQMEGIPVALMESMAAGVPVVATRLSGIPELVVDGATGLLVPERDPAALADAMERLARDGALGARLAAAAREAVRERFDRTRNVAMLEELLLGERRLRAGPAPGPSARALAPG
ncbi:MAG TPA: glycosyltransferase [Anaeromyxobacter sp.]|nr:glycosyltransferase [Anaeromyxobacter sp.]